MGFFHKKNCHKSAEGRIRIPADHSAGLKTLNLAFEVIDNRAINTYLKNTPFFLILGHYEWGQVPIQEYLLVSDKLEFSINHNKHQT